MGRASACNAGYYRSNCRDAQLMLIYDRRADLEERPGIHALIVGVSAYPFLRGGEAELERIRHTLDIRQLTGCALSAWAFFQWFMRQREHLPAPLASIRLLLSPQPEEIQSVPGMQNLGAHATLDNFLQDVWEWRNDAR